MYGDADMLLALFGTRELAFAELPHIVIAEPTGLVVQRWGKIAGAPPGVWGLGAPFSSRATDDPDYEDVPLAQWGSDRNQVVLFDTIVRCSSDAGKTILDCRFDEGIVHAYLGNNLATLALCEQWQALTRFAIAFESWVIVPLTIDTDYLVLIAAQKWRGRVLDMACWCEVNRMRLYRVELGQGRASLEQCRAGDVA